MTRRIAIIVLLVFGFAAPVSAAALTALDERKPAPSIMLQRLDGTTFDLAAVRGKVVLVNFWATWCPPCLKEIPSMQELWYRLQDREFSMIAINVGEDAESVNRFLESFESPIDFDLLLDPDLTVVKKWPVFGLPSTFMVDRAGALRYKAVGERDWADPDVVETIESLLTE